MCRIGIYLQKQHEMIVVHPNDPSTRMLSLIYEDIKDVTLFDSWEQREEILKTIAARRGRNLYSSLDTVVPMDYLICVMDS